MHIHRPLLDVDVRSPNTIQKLRATVDTIGVRHQEMQQPVFCRPQTDFLSVGTHPMTNRIEFEAACPDDFVL